ncbi:hypothetical protein EUGRSUZ_D00402 [Eucalyptus grandis]|uniref:Uncharacterized protein n=2 Tax=Eucalyptus grandis TaxID=71139 RepID=A0ACC3L3E4_EUCGR|nr:hypothetical protein EUGRSUZ_D00402 [Eucalyptus grandis]
MDFEIVAAFVSDDSRPREEDSPLSLVLSFLQKLSSISRLFLSIFSLIVVMYSICGLILNCVAFSITYSLSPFILLKYVSHFNISN